MSNPFNPAPGAIPTRILGREGELSAIREANRRAAAGEAAVPNIFIGIRGMGKTVLLGSTRHIGASKALAVQIEAIHGQSLTERLREKVDDLLKSTESLPRHVTSILRSAVKALPKLAFELPHAAGAIAISGQDHVEEQPSIGRESLIIMLRALHDAARSAKRYLVITLDEVQDADVASMKTLVTFVHESAQGPSPILFSAAGLSDTRDLMDKLRTYVQRWNMFDLRLLTLPETIEAIREPIVERRHTIAEDALYVLAEETGGYPFFIQAFASAAWDRHERDGRAAIRLEDVRHAITETRARYEHAFYLRPLAKLSPRELAVALALARLGPGPHAIGKVAAELGATSPVISSIRDTLTKKEIIAAPMPGRLEFRIPFMDRYLRDHASSYDDASVASARDKLLRRTTDAGTARSSRDDRHKP